MREKRVGEKTCMICGQAFSPLTKRQKYCGEACAAKATRRRGAAIRRRYHAQVCRNCGKSFVPIKPNQLDCCLACHHQWINRRRKAERAESRLHEWQLAPGWTREEAENANAVLEELSLDALPPDAFFEA